MSARRTTKRPKWVPRSVQPLQKRRFFIDVQEWRSHTTEIEATDEYEARELAEKLFSEEGEEAFDCFDSEVSGITVTEVHDD